MFINFERWGERIIYGHPDCMPACRGSLIEISVDQERNKSVESVSCLQLMGEWEFPCKLIVSSHGLSEPRGCVCGCVLQRLCVQVLEFFRKAWVEDQRLQLVRFYSHTAGFHVFIMTQGACCHHHLCVLKTFVNTIIKNILNRHMFLSVLHSAIVLFFALYSLLLSCFSL